MAHVSVCQDGGLRGSPLESKAVPAAKDQERDREHIRPKKDYREES